MVTNMRRSDDALSAQPSILFASTSAFADTQSLRQRLTDATMDTVAAVSAGGNQACARTSDGRVKCWGIKLLGSLGLEDTNHRRDEPDEMGMNLPFVDLGLVPGVTVTRITTGEGHTCALASDGRVKCWGFNGFGRLGLGEDPLQLVLGVLEGRLGLFDGDVAASAQRLCVDLAGRALALDQGVQLWVRHGRVVALVVVAAPVAHEAVPGPTRGVIMELASRAGIPTAVRRIGADELRGADEVVVAAATLLVRPVVRIDGHAVGGGVPGPVFLKLRQLVEETLQELSSDLPP